LKFSAGNIYIIINMTLLSLWDNLNVCRLSHSSLLEVASLKFKLNNRNTLEFDFIIIIKILPQVVNVFSIFWQNKK
jgi:hypothetical protein